MAPNEQGVLPDPARIARTCPPTNGAHLPQGIVSNKSGAPLRRAVAHLGWNTYFGPIIGADDAEQSKLHPAPISHAISVIVAKPNASVWYIGDTAVDMKVAHAACCTAISIGDAAHDGGLSDLANKGWGPHLQLPDLDQLALVLRRLAPAGRQTT